MANLTNPNEPQLNGTTDATDPTAADARPAPGAPDAPEEPETATDRLRLILGDAGLARVAGARVMVVGLGGVGLKIQYLAVIQLSVFSLYAACSRIFIIVGSAS